MASTRPACGPIRSGVALCSHQTLDFATDAMQGVAAARVVRIPVPGTPGMFIQIAPRGGAPQARALFLQTAGDHNLRLNYEYQVKTQSVDYHWEAGKEATLSGFTDLKRATKYFIHAGVMMVASGSVADIHSIVVARYRRQESRISAGWLGSCSRYTHSGPVGAAAEAGNARCVEEETYYEALPEVQPHSIKAEAASRRRDNWR
jgi:hypothetical protein